MIFGRIIQCTLITKLARRISVSDPHAVNSALVSSGESNKHPLTNCRWLIKTMASGTGATNELKTQNRLGFERSPYLLQHASNPVDWYPWGEEAFEKARKEDKLIFLSVGYSTCHWCHVMERESFENDEIAKVMNEHFINIKVDREERPDVDRMYMSFVQATSGGGGWPMSVWLTPDLMPVYGGTYYPPDERYIGQPGFKTLLNIISSQWHENRTKFTQLGARVTDVLRKTSLMDIQEDKATAYFECAEKCLKQLTDAYESCYGGFSNAPKFPQAPNMEFLFHEYARDPNSPQGEKARDMCLHTLRMMAKGGIHDHVAQGFARYSTDNHWHVPHFEKMLYDQAQLVVAYTNAYVATKDDSFAEIVHDILLYVNRDLGHKEGGFYSAEDADSYPSEGASEKREGAFCVWTHSEIKEYLSKQIPSHEPLTQAEVFSFHFNVKPEGNVDPHKDPHGELRGQNVLIVYGSEEKTAEKFRIPVDVVRQTLKESCKILFEVRQKRPKPHLDDKIITAWNALMISGFAKAGEALGEKDYVKRAEQTATFIKKYLYDEKTGNLLRSCYKGKEEEIVQIALPISGFLCDYTYLIRGLLDLYEASLNSEWLEWAEQLQEHQDKLFWDSEANGYFTSAAGDSSLLFRIKEEQDGAEPAGNAVAASNLQRMASMLDRPDLREKARGILAAFAPWLKRAPASLPVMCVAARVLREGPTAIVVSGAAEEPATAALLAVVRSRLLPGRVLSLADGRGLLHDRCEPVRRMAEKPARAYVCRRKACSLPVADPEVLEKLLDARELATPPGSPKNDRR